MSNVIILERKRARLGRAAALPRDRRARPTPQVGGPGFVSIGALSAEIVRKMGK